ncbi:MAG: GNVR domain-containing protein [Janthinobacterium lividum]
MSLSQTLRPLRPLWTGLPVMLLTTGLSLTAAWQYLRYATPLYESTAKIKLADVNEGVLNTTLLKNLDAFSGDNRTSAEVELVRSPLLLSRALDRLPFDLSTYRVGKLRTTELYRASPVQATIVLRNPRWAEEKFDVRVDAAGGVRVAAPSGELAEGRLGETLHLTGADVRLAPNDSLLRARPDLGVADHYELVRHDRARLLEAIASRLDVMSTDHFVPVLRISYQSAVPQKAADLVNALSTVYLEDYLATKYRVVNSAAESIGQQLKTVRSTLAHSEDTVQQYRDRERIVNIKQETDTDLHKVAELKMQRATLRMSLAAANDLYRYMTDGKRSALELAPNFEAFNDMLSTDIIKKIKDLQAERHDLRLRFTPEDEQVKAVDLKLADLNNYLLESIRNTRNNLTIKSRELDRAIAQAEGVFVGLPTREKDLTILQRDFQLNEKLYTFLREKETEAEIAKASPTSYHRIIASGEVPVEPTSPHRTFVLILSGFLGLLAGVLLVYLWRLVRSTPGDADGVQKETRTPLAAIIPHLTGGLAGRLAFFTQLATKLTLKGLLAPGTKLVVSAFTTHEGQQFFYDNLRAALAARGLKLRAVTLRDAQSPNPAAHPDEVLLVQNLHLDQDPHALAVMREATVNLFVVDGLRTPTRRLAELELLAQEFSLPGVQLCLNRAGYAPGPLRVLAQRLRRIFGRRRPDRPAAAPLALPLAGLDLQS